MMATSQTQPLQHLSQPATSQSRPLTYPQLLPRAADHGIPDHHLSDHQPTSWQPQTRDPPPYLEREERGHRSLPPIPHVEPLRSESSVATLENARYQKGDVPRSEHSNEDRHFKVELAGENFKVYGVFDGHDGPRAAGYASNCFMEYFNSDSWKSLVRLPPQVRKEQIPMALREFFRAAEKEFFDSIRSAIEEKKELQRDIPSVSVLHIHACTC